MIPWRMRAACLVAAAVLAAACARPPGPAGAPGRAPGFRPSELRWPVVVLRVVVDPGAFGERERTTLPAALEGRLLDGLDARAVPPRDARLVTGDAVDAGAALARARELGADHVILVEARLARGPVTVCRDAPRPFTATVTRISQAVRVLRVADGIERLGLGPGDGLVVDDLDPDCASPRASTRRAVEDLLADAVQRLLAAVLGP